MKTKLHFLKCSVLLVIFFQMFAASAYSQNITSTIGTGGTFTIKDVSSNFMTLSQSTGQMNLLRSLRLESTTSSGIGIIFKGTARFLHNFGSNNTFLGVNSGNFTLTGSENTAMGWNSLFSNTTGNGNTALGGSSLYSNNIGSYNTSVGLNSLYFNSSGNSNTCVGDHSLYYNTTGSDNTAVGLQSLHSNTSGNNNTAVGLKSLYSNTTGLDNTANGQYSLFSNNTGNGNTALGLRTLNNNSIGNGNTAVGLNSLIANTTGSYNTAMGRESLLSNTTGSNNTALGDNAGFTITTGVNLICIGKDAVPTSGSAVNQITLGDNSISSLRCNVTTITSLSDARDKKKITDLKLGLDFIMKLNPRQFNWDKREWYENNISDGSKMKEAPTAGFIAQELDEVQTAENAEWLNLVLKDNPEKIEATYGNLLPVMVKAIQDLKKENDLLKQSNEKLSAEVESFKSISNKLLKLEQVVNKMVSDKNNLSNTNQINVISNEPEEK